MRSQNAKDKLSRAEALQLWHRVNLGSVLADQPDLSTRQLALLTCVYLEPAPHTVRSLATRLNVTKAVITRALNTLGQYGFITRGPDPNDGRSVLVRRTGRGARYLSDFAERVRFEAKTLQPLARSASRVA
ncbi:MAG: MarR family transcriptional regulator [Acidimicrobiales bacterium]|nr:MarR family transcriptional regulator [Hyphomonadaceae bacterium]RZV44396.1 MAG: MarR family transcriptional regulator [Acidimicrobiales bacterium]